MTIIFFVCVLVWAGSELFVLLFKTDFKKNFVRSDPTIPLFLSLLFLSIGVTIAGFIVVDGGKLEKLRLFSALKIVAVFVMAAGIGIRWLAIRKLKTSFSSLITTEADQVLITTGIYAHIRHPSYLGSIISFCGFNLYFENAWSFVVALLLVTFAYVYRIRFEERVLEKRFGTEYEEYRRTSCKLIPRIY
jgi:protein-S-isoprenylcysteine O-methyltransferase